MATGTPVSEKAAPVERAAQAEVARQADAAGTANVAPADTAPAAEISVLVGHETGGGVLQALIAQHPERVAGLVLIDTLPLKTPSRRWHPGFRAWPV